MKGLFRFFVLAILGVSTPHGAFAQSVSEVHAVGIYQGATPQSAMYRAAVRQLERQCDRNPRKCQWGRGWERIQKRFPFTTTVKVSRVGVPVTLVLSGYARTEWRIEVARGVNLQRIIMSGYETQTLKKTRSIVGVPVTKSFYGAPLVEDGDFFAFYGDDRERAVSFASFEGNVPFCAEPENESMVPPYTSQFKMALDYLGKLGLTLTSAQGGVEVGSIQIDGNTQGIKLSKVRASGLCYRNADGSLSHGTD